MNGTSFYYTLKVLADQNSLLIFSSGNEKRKRKILFYTKKKKAKKSSVCKYRHHNEKMSAVCRFLYDGYAELDSSKRSRGVRAHTIYGCLIPSEAASSNCLLPV